MLGSDGAGFGYRIEREPTGWRWVAFGLEGAILAQGDAPSRAAAAACVIRVLAGAHTAAPAAQGETASNRPAW